MQDLDITAQVLVASATFYVWVRAMREQRRRQPSEPPETPAALRGVPVPVRGPAKSPLR